MKMIGMETNSKKMSGQVGNDLGTKRNDQQGAYWLKVKLVPNKMTESPAHIIKLDHKLTRKAQILENLVVNPVQCTYTDRNKV